MKKFLVKVLILFSILGTLLLWVNTAYINTDYYKTMNGMDKFLNVPEHIDVVNFGASHSQSAFRWESYEEFEGINMALGAQTITYDEALFDYYMSHFDEDTTVIMEIMFKSLYEDEQIEGPYGSNITRYYQILPREYILQWNIEDAVKFNYIPILGNRQAAISNMLEEYLIRESKQSNPDKVLEGHKGEKTQLLEGWEENAMIEEGQRRANGFVNASGNQEKGMQYEALIRIIEKCKTKNMQIILVTAPTLPCFYEKIDKDFMEQFYRDIEDICAKYDLEYYDYTADERMLEDYGLYVDTDHLNGNGGRVFTQIFLEDHKDILKFYN